MSIANKFRSAFRGDVSLLTLIGEVLRRRRAARQRAIERRDLDEIGATPARLVEPFASMSPLELLTHFREKPSAFFALDDIGERSMRLFPDETAKLVEDADRIVEESVWELAGFGPLEFKGENIWRRDPLGSKDWGLDYHADVVIFSDDCADIRVLWELNRFGHAVTLACAFAVTNDERYAETFFSHIEDWMAQNAYGRGANWNCAMETALRAINLLTAFDIFRGSKACTEQRLALILQLFDQHGRFTLDNNEFSYLATSNHYLSDLVGLLWLSTLLPEMESAADWQEVSLADVFREIDKQVLPDGADFESSTGYHNFVTEMLLLTFLVCRRYPIPIADKYWQKLGSMFDYIHGIIRPDLRTPLIGDADGSQIVPIVKRDSDDVAYLLALGAVIFDEPKFREFAELTPEMLWLLGEDAIDKYNLLVAAETTGSLAFPDAGGYVMRDGDLYLHFNTNDTGVNGRGSHAHNDALSIEVSAFGRAFIVDPGSFAYNLDRKARHRFRSTAYHSTVMIDCEEQTTTVADLPFILGNQARPNVREWRTSDERDVVAAEHFGYTRLRQPVIHRRTIEFDKTDKYWLIKDELSGGGEHDFVFSFHIASGLVIEHIDGSTIKVNDREARTLIIQAIGIDARMDIVAAFVSRNYGHIEDSSIVRWPVSAAAPLTARFILVPCGPRQNIETRLELLGHLADNIDN
jgi:hypothetical protein